MTNSHHEQLRARIEEVRTAECMRDQAIEVATKAEKRLGDARLEVDKAHRQLAQTIWSKCQGKQMICDGVIFTVRRNVVGDLEMDSKKFMGEIL